MGESVDDNPLGIEGPLLDLLDPQLSVLPKVELKPNSQGWYVDLKRVEPGAPMVLAAAGRITACQRGANRITYSITTPAGIHASTRLLLPHRPVRVLVDNQPANEQWWEGASRTLLIRHRGTASPVPIAVEW